MVYMPKSFTFYVGLSFLIIGSILMLTSLRVLKEDPFYGTVNIGVGSVLIFVGLFIMVLWKHPKGARISASKRF
jgi:hypothetical protein